MELLARSALVRLAIVVVIAVVVQMITHVSWFAMALLVTYFVAKEIVGMMLRTAPAVVLIAAEPRLRVAAFAFDNLAFLAAIVGFFLLQRMSSSSDGFSLGRFAAFELAVIVFVAGWGMVAATAIRRGAGVAKV